MESSIQNLITLLHSIAFVLHFKPLTTTYWLISRKVRLKPVPPSRLRCFIISSLRSRLQIPTTTSRRDHDDGPASRFKCDYIVIVIFFPFMNEVCLPRAIEYESLVRLHPACKAAVCRYVCAFIMLLINTSIKIRWSWDNHNRTHIESRNSLTSTTLHHRLVRRDVRHLLIWDVPIFAYVMTTLSPNDVAKLIHWMSCLLSSQDVMC